MSETLNVSAQWPSDSLSRFRLAVRLVQWADEIGPMVREELKKQAPARDIDGGGRLRQSIRYKRSFAPDGGAIQWTANTPYAEFVIHGTKPHEIKPKATKALRFLDSHGGVAFARHAVHHRGAKANDFPKRTAEAIGPRIYESFRRHITEGI